MSFVALGIQYFVNPLTGKPVYNGYIYVGEPDMDPTVEANQKDITLKQENGVEVATTQPVRTGLGGVPLYNNAPVQIIVDGNYSLVIQDANGDQVYYVPSGASLTTLGSVTIRKQLYTAVGGETIINMINGFAYTPGQNDLNVYIDGVMQFLESGAYAETSTTSITMSEALAVGQEVLMVTNDFGSSTLVGSIYPALNSASIWQGLPMLDARMFLDGNGNVDFQQAIDYLKTYSSTGGWIIDGGQGQTRQNINGFTITRGITVQLAATQYAMNSEIYIEDGGHLVGMGSERPGGTEITVYGGASIDAIISNDHNPSADNYDLVVKDLYVRATGNNAQGLNFTRLYDNCRFENIIIYGATGDGFALYGGACTPTSLKQIICFANGGYGFNIDCYRTGSGATANSTTNLILDTCGGDDNDSGAFRFYNGAVRSSITLLNPKVERRGSSAVPDQGITLDDFEGSLTVVGGSFYSAESISFANDLIHIVSKQPSIQLFGFVQTRYINLLVDDYWGVTIPSLGNHIHHFEYGYNAGAYHYSSREDANQSFMTAITDASHEVSVIGEAEPRTEIRPGRVTFGDGTNPVQVGVAHTGADILALFGGQVQLDDYTQTTVGAAGGASALPATPKYYLPVFISGLGEFVLALYNKS